MAKKPPSHLFTPTERDLIRLELIPLFGQELELANGLFLHTWRGGLQKNQPKAMRGMLDRGPLEIRTNPMEQPAAFFTRVGLAALRQFRGDRRAMNPER
jgi:hypothetical protein